MRTPIRPILAFALGALVLAAAVRAAAPGPPPLISSERIDRFEAIRLVQQMLDRNPKSLADWIILGELAHEVAMDMPADQAQKYLQMSRDAFEKALALAPNNPGLKAAVQFAQEQAENFNRFEETRKAAARMYVDTRRRDLAATNYTPMVRAFAPLPGLAAASRPAAGTVTAPAATAAPTPAANDDVVVSAPEAAAITPPANTVGGRVVPDPDPAITPAPRSRVDTASYGTHLLYANPVYMPYAGVGGVPYTYQQYSSMYYPYGYYSNQNIQPMTLQRYAQALDRGAGAPRVLDPSPAVNSPR